MSKKEFLKFFIIIIAGFIFSVLVFNYFAKQSRTPELGIFVDAFVDNYLSRHTISKETFEKQWTLKEPEAEILCDNTSDDEMLKIIINGNVYSLLNKKNSETKIDKTEFDEKFSSLPYDKKVKDYIEYGKFVCLYD